MIAGFVGLAMVFAFVVAPTNASAQTIEELQDQIQALLEMINQLQGGTSGNTSGIPPFTRDLTMGSTGTDVMNLQKFLNGKGFTVAASGAGSTGMESNYFGGLTKAALASFQASKGIAPAVGYFGPISRTAINAMLADDNGNNDNNDDNNDNNDNNDNGDLEGGAGSISDVDYVSKLSNEEVGEGQDDVEVAGLDIEADESSDIEITAVNLNFSQGTAGSKFDKYADEVSVWFEGEELARVDAADFTNNNNYDRNISLDRGAIIRADQRGSLIVAVSGISNLDSADEQDTWTLEFESVRFRDAQNAIISDTTTGVINDAAGRTFSFESFSSAANIELKIAAGSAQDEINEARAIEVDASNDTDNVALFAVTAEAEGTSDINIDDWPFLFTATGAASPTIYEIANTVELWIDGERVDSLSVPSTATTTSLLTFDDFDYTISAGDKVDVEVRADLNDLEGDFAEGDTLSVQFGEAESGNSGFTPEDEQGNSLTDSERTGGVVGDAHTFYDNGILVSLVSTNTSENAVDGVNNDYVNLTIVFSVTAFGQTAYIPNVATDMSSSTSSTGGAPSTAQGIGYHLQYNTSGVASSSVTEVLTSTAQERTNSFQVNQGETKNFTLKVTVANSADPIIDSTQYRAVLTGINFAASDSATGAKVFTSNLQNDFKTGYALIAD